ncbi:hypothetical protein BV22DRAFT_1024693 [Leucogyrophana mollusca]|uniref:Uncharacterized protein n=1 Tax=Leucogyrophana mollusca TaxID=85980 RepID=A0ACB8AYM0_9AGAM|nr:hypothetical protein BV22DRAFT_1024693 [Leucogyrophana mollusca]
MIGYAHRKQAYKLLDVKQRTVFSSRHVVFNETGKASETDFAPWKNPVKVQWEGLLPNPGIPDQDLSEDDELEFYAPPPDAVEEVEPPRQIPRHADLPP